VLGKQAFDETNFNFDSTLVPALPYLAQPGASIVKAISDTDYDALRRDYDAIADVAKRYSLLVLEDACQSFGASHQGCKACSFGNAAATSFFPAKPLGCYGDGGAVFTNDSGVAATMRSLRIHGQGVDKYHNDRIGINGRLDTLQAAILLAKLEIFDEEMRLRQEVAGRYATLLKDTVTSQHIPGGSISAWAQYSVLSDNRDATLGRLSEAKIPTAIYYPIPLHLQKAFADLEYEPGSMPVAESVAGRIFSLPMHPYLGAQEQEQIAASVKAG
jgi:dTDP-4-amino-4,6-dideoxygalactose transaminase